MDRSQRRAHLLILASTALVATSFPVASSVAGALDSAVLVVLRFSLASLLLLPVVLLRHRARALPGPRDLARYALLSAPLCAFFLAMFEALRTTTPLNTAATFTLAPIFAALFARLLSGERTSAQRWAALGVGMLGAGWVVFRGEAARIGALELERGDAYFLAGTAALGLYSALVKPLHRGEPMEVVTLWTLITGTGWMLIPSLTSLGSLRWVDIGGETWLAVAYLALFTTLVTFYLTQLVTARLGATRTMAYTYLNPTLVALLAWALGDERPGWRWIPGIALTLTSMTAVAWTAREGATRGTASPAPGAARAAS